MSEHYISIEGNIGAGKTTLAKLLAERTGSDLLLERFEANPYLSDFYSQPEAYAFHVEMFFLTERFKTLREYFAAHTLPVVADYAFHKSMFFAEVNLGEPDIDIFRTSYELMKAQLPDPDLVIYLYHDVARVQARIRERGRSFELSIKDAYLEQVQASYLKHLKTLNSQVIVLNASEKDFLEKPEHVEEILSLVNSPRQKGLKYVGFEN